MTATAREAPAIVLAQVGDQRASKAPDKAAAYPRFPRKTPYAKARENLVAAGWQPAVPKDPDPCEPGDTRCEGRPEMESCAGTGEGNCLFVWQKDKVFIEVTTRDDPPLVVGVKCRLGCSKGK
jgi:hypothetical protein